MTRIAAGTVILIQLWMLTPLCCCSLKMAMASGGSGNGCGCAERDDAEREEGAVPAEKDSNCRCSENKIELPPPTAAMSELTTFRLTLDPLVAHTQIVPAILGDSNGPKDFRERPPPLPVADRLSTLHRLNL